VSDQNNNLTPLSKEKAFLILAGMVGVLAFIVYGLYPDTKEVPTIPNSGQGNKIQTYDQLLGLGQDINGNGQPAWREIVFGGASTSTDNSTTSNLTVGLARDVMTLGVLSNKDSTINTDTYMSAMIDTAAQNITIKDVGQINISADTSRSALKLYGNDAALVFGAFFGNEQKELKDLQAYMNNNNTKSLDSIKTLQKSVFNLCEQFKKVSAPKNIAALHRNTLEQCYYYSDILAAFVGVTNDPTSALVAVGQYQQMTNMQIELLDKMREFFNASNVIFGPSDYGRIFNKNI
jgi:hypothetical protein